MSVVAGVMVGVLVGGWRRRRRVTERRRDGGRLDGDDARVHDLTVDLHHHLVTLGGVIETLCGGEGSVTPSVTAGSCRDASWEW